MVKDRSAAFFEAFIELVFSLSTALTQAVALLTIDQLDKMFGMARYVISNFACFIRADHDKGRDGCGRREKIGRDAEYLM